MTVLIVTFLLAVFASVGLFLYDKTQGVRNDITVKAYMKVGTESDPATLDKVHNQLVAIPYVKTVTYVSPTDALKQLNKDLQKDAGSLDREPAAARLLHEADQSRQGVAGVRRRRSDPRGAGLRIGSAASPTARRSPTRCCR